VVDEGCVGREVRLASRLLQSVMPDLLATQHLRVGQRNNLFFSLLFRCQIQGYAPPVPAPAAQHFFLDGFSCCVARGLSSLSLPTHTDKYREQQFKISIGQGSMVYVHMYYTRGKEKKGKWSKCAILHCSMASED
jgi:hypothetical protein